MEQNKNTPRNPRRRTPYQRNRRQKAQWLSWLLIGTVVLFTVLGLIVKDREFSESENRSLAQFPKFSEGGFLSGLGDYVADQFPGRDLWIRLNLGLNRFFGQQEASGVFLGKDDYLIQAPGAPDEENLRRNLQSINSFGAKHGDLKHTMAIIPNAATIHADKLPANAPVRDQQADLKRLDAALTKVKFVDVTDKLCANNTEELFYRTDHHWTSLAAAYAFETLGF